MVVVNVKNTIVERVLQIIAPHPCFSCGKLGQILCASCKYDIVHEPFLGCIACSEPHPEGICAHHKKPFTKAIVVGVRTGSLEQVINALKFRRTRSAAPVLASLLHARIPQFIDSVVIIPVPTQLKHVRQRGYDQVKLITRYFAAKRNLPIADVLVRTKSTTQHEVGRADRASQANSLYALRPGVTLDEGRLYLLVDDIVTTSATVTAAAECIASAGGRVWVAALAYQSEGA